MSFFTDPASLPKVIQLHGAAVETPGGVVLLMGHSGAGKSTLSRMLSERFPKFADDQVNLRWHAGKGWLAENGIRPMYKPYSIMSVCGFVRIYQAPHNLLVPISARKCCQYLTDALFEVADQRQLDYVVRKQLFGAVAQIAREYPGWEYHFSLDQTAIDLFDQHFRAAANGSIYLTKETCNG